MTGVAVLTASGESNEQRNQGLRGPSGAGRDLDGDGTRPSGFLFKMNCLREPSGWDDFVSGQQIIVVA